MNPKIKKIINNFIHKQLCFVDYHEPICAGSKKCKWCHKKIRYNWLSEKYERIK